MTLAPTSIRHAPLPAASLPATTGAGKREARSRAHPKDRLIAVLSSVGVAIAAVRTFPVEGPELAFAYLAILLLLLFVLQPPRRMWPFLAAVAALPLIPGLPASLALISFGSIMRAVEPRRRGLWTVGAAAICSGAVLALLQFSDLYLVVGRATHEVSWLLRGARLGPYEVGIAAQVYLLCLLLVVLTDYEYTRFQKLQVAIILITGLLFTLALHPAIGLAASAAAGWSASEGSVHHVQRHRLPLVLGAAACLSLLVASGGIVAGPPASSVAFLKGPMAFFERPPANPAVRAESPNFAGMLDLASAYGLEAAAYDRAEFFQSFRRYHVAVVANPTEAFSPVDIATFEEYVRSGGRLLVLGDHTDIGGIQEPLNALLAATGIRFRFDSAIPGDSPSWRWANCLRGTHHPSFWRRYNDTLGISVGASLQVHAPARALVIGERGFSDIGRPDYGISRLGNMQWDQKEMRGSLALVAEQRLGKGTIQVWGDTTGFQTARISDTHAFVATLLKDGLGLRRPAVGPWLSLSLTLAAIAAVLWGCRASPLATVVVAVVIAIAPTLGTATHRKRAPAMLDCQRIVVFDRELGSRLPARGERGGISRLADCVQRSGRLLVRADAIALVERGARPAAIIVAAPTRPLGERRAEALLRYMHSGGLVVVSAGFNDASRLAPLLAEHEMTIHPVVLGPAHNSRIVPQAGAADDHWPLEYDAEIPFKEAFAVHAPAAAPLVTCRGYVLVARQVVGAGQLVLIGDSRFFEDGNLGNAPTMPTKAEMVEFVLDLLDDA